MFDKKLKDCTLDELKADRNDLVSAISAEAVTSVTNELNNLKADNERASKIRKASFELGLYAEGEKLIAEGKSVEDAVLALAGIVQQQNASNVNKFYASAPEAAGKTPEKKDEIELPKTRDAAYQYCKKVYNIDAKAEAWRKARLEFPELFRNNNEKGE
jgi:hypothetical protein